MKFDLKEAILVGLIFLASIPLFSQESKMEELIEFFTIPVNEKAYERDSSLYPAKIILAPVISYSPETNLALGVGAKWLFKIKGSGDETRTSNMPVSFQYTLNNQFIIFSAFEVFLPQEKGLLIGNAIFQNFPRLYYGVGPDTRESDEITYDISQTLIEPNFLKQTKFRYLFLGAGIRYNRMSNVSFRDTENPPSESMINGVNGSESFGLQLSAVYDSRGNILNSSNGWFIQFSHGFYDDSALSSQTFQITRFDVKHFFKPSKRRTDVIGLQLKAHFSHLDVPYYEMAFFGGDEIMRGYYEGRFVARHAIMSQAEYRKQIAGRIGGVLFVGAGSVSQSLSDLASESIRWTVGAGIRFLLDKREDLNIRFDWGFTEESNNQYLNIAEAF